MSIVKELKDNVSAALQALYDRGFPESSITISATKPEFTGDYTLVLFAFVKELRKSPEQLGHEIGAWLQQEVSFIESFNVIKGFLNLVISDAWWGQYLDHTYGNTEPARNTGPAETVIVEYSSPNTNKPLHLGHLRNNFLGWSVAEILKYSGYEVWKTAILNDRGIHICKSMMSWQLFADGATPESTGIKGDHFVGDWYVKAESTIKEQAAVILRNMEAGDLSGLAGETVQTQASSLVEQINQLQTAGKPDEARKMQDQLKEIARNSAPFMRATQDMLRKWEENDPAVRALWEKMNGWVYEGFNETYRKIESDFDQNYFESQTYLLGKDFVAEGLSKGVFFRKEDGSVWIDLTADGLDEKLVLRKDGTSVYITQDLGLADRKYEQYKYDQSIYVIADEQNYHMKVLRLILQKLEKPYADGIYHLSYGLVELPSGRMKTREGTVVDADDLIQELKNVARQKTEELGKVNDFNPGELNELYDTIAIGALKFFLLRVDPKKRMIFNPEESIDFHGFTGPFIQWTHARIRSILRKASVEETTVTEVAPVPASGLLPKEKALIVHLEQYASVIAAARAEHNPSLLAIYAFETAKTFNGFYTEHSVMTAESPAKKELRLKICQLTANTIRSAMYLMGIRVPDRM